MDGPSAQACCVKIPSSVWKLTVSLFRKLALVGIIPNQSLFSFSSDKDRRADSRIRRKNTAQPRRESNPGSGEWSSRTLKPLSYEDWTDFNPASFRWSLRACRLGQSGSPRSGKRTDSLQGESREFTRCSRCGFVAQWLERATRPDDSQDPGFDSRRGCAVFLRLIRLSVLLSLSELKEKRIWLL